ncbi:OB-fold protein [Pseudomonas viridiflava]|uniref:OB-fold protein n=1 Tax=Pseudomonas viridiflava TaxID=33069 RepID=UPI000F05809F|nr:hypothetical protein [Pseudomonas viridiflava]
MACAHNQKLEKSIKFKRLQSIPIRTVTKWQFGTDLFRMPRYLIVMESEMNEMKVPSSPRKVGIILGILIALMPQFFAWLLLRKGHTKKARLIGFGWMALWMIISLVLHKPANRDSSASVAPAVAVAPAASPASPAEVVPVPAPAPAAKPVAQATAEPVAEPVKAYTALQVSTGYDENTVAADMLYKDKRVQVTGRILDINTDFMGYPYLILAGHNRMLAPQFKFGKSHLSSIAALKKGAEVSVVCTGTGDLAKTPMFNDCVFPK